MCVCVCVCVRQHSVAAGWTFLPPSGGYFLWLCLPSDLKSTDVVTAAKARFVCESLNDVREEESRKNPQNGAVVLTNDGVCLLTVYSSSL